jgi:hypothetical protein
MQGHHGDSYGARLRGFLVPWQTGQYRFWIAADDAAELWISRDDDAAHKQLVCLATEWTGTRQWEQFPSQKSIPLFLEAGRRYYIEALYKQNAGADGMAVAWQMPGGKRELIRSDNLVPVEVTASKNRADDPSLP